MKKLENLNGAKTLNKSEQKSITGGEYPASCSDLGCSGMILRNCQDYCHG